MTPTTAALLAGLIAFFHALWVLFNVTGFFWARRRPVLGKIHVATLGTTIALILWRGGCPLTSLEWRLRRLADPAAAPTGGFISHHLGGIVTDQFVGWTTIALLLLSVYLHLWRPWRRSKAAPTA